MITFLFGSGADSDYNDKLKSGAEFSRALLLDTYSDIKKEILNVKNSDSLIHPNSTKVFLQTIASNEELARKVLSKDDVDKCINYYNESNEKVEYEEIRKICKQWFDILKDNQSKNKDIRDFFFHNAVFFDSLDGKFNSLRVYPYNKNAKKAMSAYLSVYIFMLKCMFEIRDDFIWSYSNIIDLLNDKSKILQPKSEENYYSILKKSELDCNIITTNYTPYVKEMISKEVVYLHGKMTLFEDLKHLFVYDCTYDKAKIEDNLEYIIPFIMIPSGIKPIICPTQIDAFYSFMKQLDQSELLVVVGYKFNSEDNHINSIINNWLLKDKNKMVYFNYDKSVDFDKLQWIRSSSSVETVEYIDEHTRINFTQKITNIIVNNENSKIAYKAFLKNIGGNI